MDYPMSSPSDVERSFHLIDEIDSDSTEILNSPAPCPCRQYLPFGHHDPQHHRPKAPVPPPAPEPPLRSGGDAASASHASTVQSKDVSHVSALRSALQNAGREALFTCGGTLPMNPKPKDGLPHHPASAPDLSLEQQTEYPKPVRIYWNTTNNTAEELSLPVSGENSEQLGRMIAACTPATFGRGGEDVYDEQYRWAGAIDSTNFCTSFCPYEAGIIDIITQLLLPPIVGDLKPGPKRSALGIRFDLTENEVSQIDYAIQRATFLEKKSLGHSMRVVPNVLGMLDIPVENDADWTSIKRDLARMGVQGGDDTLDNDKIFQLVSDRLRGKRRLQHGDADSQFVEPKELRRRMMCRGIRAELYKLNVYSGPSGHFNPHVDTPRSETQIGTLVVALPVAFEGGALAMRHRDEEIIYDWASDAAQDPTRPSLRWAAFYSDCEHEVMEVTSGHRVTLTYNLYLASGTGLLNGRPSSLESVQFPLYHRLQAALRSPQFEGDGGYLGIFLAHSYPHTHEVTHRFVPAMLKGMDMVVFESVHAAGLVCTLEPIEEDRLVRDSDVFQRLEMMSKSPWLVREQDGPLNNLSDVLTDDYEDENGERYMKLEQGQEIAEDHGWTDFDETWEPPPAQDDEPMEEDDDDDDDIGYDDQLRPARTDPRFDKMYMPGGFKRLLDQVEVRRRITWLNSGCKDQELSRIWLAYGNQAQLEVGYSSVALIVRVPSWAERSARFSGREESAVADA